MKQLKGRKAALHNLGCKVNAYETDSMAALLKDAGMEIVPFSEKADVYVINTCSVTNIADRKSRQMIHRARNLNPSAIVVAAGCYVQTAIDKTGLDIDADIILGTGRKQDLVREIIRYMDEQVRAGSESGQEEAENKGAGRRGLVDVTDLRTDRSMDDLVLPQLEGHTRAYIKVQDGCDMYCSYCIIPYARGHVRSRKPEEIVSELTRLAGKGTKEVVLTGIHLSSYGVDFPESSGSVWQERSKLVDLIELVSHIDGIQRIRLGSLEPTIITEETAERLSRVGNLCPHFHLALQSGSDSVLERMNRHYTTDEYRRCLKVLRKWFDDPALTTDVIVGFPGETEREFAETVEYLKEIRLYETHIFRYSRRAGTRADRMEGQLPENVKAERAAILEKLNEENRMDYMRSKSGKAAEVLVEEMAGTRVPNAARGQAPGNCRSENTADMTGEKASHGNAGQGGIPVDSRGRKLYAGYTKEYIRAYVASDHDIRGEVVRGRLLVESSAFLV